jgi:hypothetical protein
MQTQANIKKGFKEPNPENDIRDERLGSDYWKDKE